MVQKRNIKYEIILALLKQREIHLRAISKLIKISHSTVYREIIKLKKENILNYEVVGRNKSISLKKNIETIYYLYQSEYYKTIKCMEKYPELSIIIEKILNKTKQNLIILFGSYSKGIVKKDSDIDIFIETNNRNIKKELENINSKLNIKIGEFDNKTLLGKEIIKDHVIIKGVELFYEKNPIFN